MKQEATKKSKLWLWLVIGIVALVAIAGVVLGILFANPGEEDVQEGPTGGRPELYWNVDRADYIEADTGMSNREPAEDGTYYIQFAIDGEQVELPIIDKQLVNYIDSMDVMGLVKDADGMVIDAVDVNTIAKEMAKGFVVQSIEGDVITLDSSVALNGMEVIINRSEMTRFFNITDSVDFKGQEIELDDILPMDFVTVYGNDLGEATHFVIIEHPVDSPVYWRTTQMYNSTTKETTRVPDENGVYEIEFFVNGERVTLKCKDKELVTAIDKPNKFLCHTGLIFDEEGYIIDTQSSFVGIRGKLGCALYETIEVNGTTFTAQRQIAGGTEVGQTYTNTWDENTEIYDVSYFPVEEERGKLTDTLKVGDRLVVFEDSTGKPVVIFVAHRLCDSPMYFNLAKSTKTVNGVVETGRTPVNGWYTIEMLVNGEIKKLRTQDKDLMTQIDKQSSRAVGLALDGDIITRVWGHEHVDGYGSKVGYYVDSITSIVMTITNINGTATATCIMNSACEVYNVSGIGGEIGSKTTPQVGDYCIITTNPAGEAMHVYVLQRYVESAEVCYLLDGRKYSSKTQATTRVPDEETGYYTYKVACNGKVLELKTRSKALATKIDKNATYNIIALDFSGSTIHEAYVASAATGGQRKGAGYYVRGWQEDGSLLVYSKSSTATQELVFAEDCKFYNVSPDFVDFRGERMSKSGIKADDMIVGLTDKSGKIVILYVANRDFYAPFCWHVKRMYDSTNQVTTREPDEEGYYVFELVYDGEIKTFKTKDKDLATEVDSKNAAFSIRQKDGIIKSVIAVLDVTGIDAAGEVTYGSEVVEVKGNKLTVKQPDGTVTTVTLHKDWKAYDISGTAEQFGEYSELKPGDKLRTYMNKDKQYTHILILSRYFPRLAGDTGLCEHCGEVVTWTAWGGESLPAKDGHYYLTRNKTHNAQVILGSDSVVCDVVIDLNGMTLQSDHRAFLVYKGAQLSIVDSIGTGRVEACGAEDGDQGAVIRIANPGTVNLYGGTYTMAENAYTAYRGGVVYVNGAQAELNVYNDVVIEGGVATYKEGGKAPQGGGNIFINAGLVNLYGGTVTGGTALEGTFGDNVYNFNGTLNIEGGKVDGGIFNFGEEPEEPVADLNAVYEAAKAMTFAADGETQKCPVCDKEVVWNVLPAATGEGRTVLTAGHYYVAEDLANTACYEIGSTVCVNLNGKTVTSTDSVFYVTTEGTMTIMGEGAVTGIGTSRVDTAVEAAIHNRGVLNLCGGTYTRDAAALYSSTITQHGDLVVYEGTKITGPQYGIRATMGHIEVWGGEISATLRVASVNATAHITGAPVITTFQVATNKITVGELTEGAKINVALAPADGIITEKLADEAVAEYFTTSIAGKELKVVDGALVAVDTNPVDPEQPIPDRVKGNTGVCEHCGETVTWKPWAGEAVPAENGHYYLHSDATGTQLLLGNDNVDFEVVIDLNGKTYDSNARGFLVYKGEKLAIIDSVGGGKVIGRGASANDQGAVIRIAAPGTVDIYGGTFTQAADAKTAFRGGVVIVNGATCTLNMYGGSIEGGVATYAEGKAAPQGGGNIFINQGVANLVGGTVSGGQVVGGAEGANIYNYKGTLNITGCTVDGGIVTYEEPTTEPTEPGTEPSTEATEPSTEATEPQPSEPTAEELEIARLNALDNSSISEKFAEGTTKATCPYCQTEVEWTALTQNTESAAVALEAGHYYLAESLENVAGYTVSAGKQVCVHLNGNSVNTTTGNVFGTSSSSAAGESLLNLMGEGVVSTSGNNSVMLLKGNVNFLGGTIKHTGTTGSVVLQRATGILNLYNGVTFDLDEGVTGGSLVLFYGRINMYGGNINKGIVKIEGYQTSGTYPQFHFNMYGGAIKDGITVSNNYPKGELTISGDSVILANNGGLRIADGKKLTVGELGENAAIAVTANGTFTTELTNAEEVAEHFTAANADYEIVVADNALAVVEKMDPNKVYEKANAMVFGAELPTTCPFCNTTATWTTLPAANGNDNVVLADGHYYVAESLENTRPYSIEGNVCIHLNGKDITSANYVFITGAEANLTVMGQGVVTGASTTNGAIMTVNGTLNLCGGTFHRAEGVTTHMFTNPTGNKGAIVNVYEGTVLEATGASKENLFRMMADDAQLNICGGELKGLAARSALNAQITVSGSPVVEAMQIAGNNKLIVGELTEGAMIAIQSATDDVITGVLENAEEIVGFFTASAEDKEVTVVDGALKLTAKPVEPEQPTDPEQPTEPTEPSEPSTEATEATTEATEATTEATEATTEATEATTEATEATTEATEATTEATEPVTLPADCACCEGEETVTWAPLPEAGELAAGHYVLDANKEIAAPYTLAADAVVCVYFQGANLTSTDKVFDVTTGTLNIMGEGVIMGAGATDASTILCNGGKINLAGATVKHAATTAYPSVMQKAGTVTIYDGAVLTADEGTVGNNLYIVKGTAIMKGGVISNGTGATKAQCALTACSWGGNVLIKGTGTNAAGFYMYGGEIFGGKAEHGGNIGMPGHFGGTGAMTLRVYGGKIYNGEATHASSTGGNIHALSKGNRIILRVEENLETGAPVEIYGGKAVSGGNISLTYTVAKDADGKVTSTAPFFALRGGKIYNGVATANGGNVFLSGSFGAAIGAMNDTTPADPAIYRPTEIYGGQAVKGGNVYAACSKLEIKEYGTIRDGVATENGADIYTASSTKYTSTGTVDETKVYLEVAAQ